MFERRNIALKIEYDGTEYSGWQRQTEKPSIQAIIEDELGAILKKRVVVYGASRTDSGVHARAQVANFWGDSRYEADQWAKLLNFYLPKSIRIVKSVALDEKFHSQRLAVSKTYEYVVLNRRIASALDTRVYFYPRELDWDRVEASLPYFVGTHDFASFQGAKAGKKTTVRTVSRFEMERKGEGIYRFEVEGQGFLKQMVRTMIGTVMEVGEGKREPTDIAQIINARDRRRAGRTVPAEGLCLLKIEYPSPYDLF